MRNPWKSAGSPRRLVRWGGRVFLTLGRALYLGPSWDTSPHAHHAMQVCVGLDGPFKLRGGRAASWRNYPGALVAANHPHQLDGRGANLLLLYLEPESAEGRRFSRGLRERAIVPLAPEQVRAVRAAWKRHAARNLNNETMARLYDLVREAIRVEEQEEAPLDARIGRAIRLLQEDPETRRSVPALAKSLGLSPSRFRHLFMEQVGTSCRSFIIWMKLNDAVAALGRGASFTRAALDSGFSDAAHFTRTFRRMFGVAPSQIRASVKLAQDARSR